MLAISLSQIEEIVQPELASPFNLFKVSVIEIAEKIQTTLAPETSEDIIVVDGLFDGHVDLVERASNFVDLPLSFYVLSGFVYRHDDVSNSSFMDLSIFFFSISLSLMILLYLHLLHPRHRYLTLMMRLHSMI